MKLIVTSTIIWLSFVLSTCAFGDEKQKNDSMPRNDLYHIELSDGSWLRLQASIHSEKERQTSGVSVVLYPKGKGGVQPKIWAAHLTSVDYEPKTKGYYALVKVKKDRIFVFFLWNGQHYTIDRHTGQILKKGAGDDALKEYRDFIPLKLIIMPGFPSSGRTMTEQEAKELLERDKRELLKPAGK